MVSTSNFEVAIVGGGISGVTLALDLLARGVAVQIYEKARSFGEIGAGIAFTPNARRAMKIGHEGVYRVYEQVAIKSLLEEKRDVYFELLNGYDNGTGTAAVEGGCNDGEQKRRDELKRGEKMEEMQQEERSRKEADLLEPVLRTYAEGGASGCHRAHFLDGIVELLPEGVAHFGKELVDLEERPDGQVKLMFRDGTHAFSDAVVGCDGIKSRVRRILVGEDHPSALPQYTHKYGYRLIISMEDAIKAVGEERAKTGTIYMGHKRRLITFPIADDLVNLNAICHDAADWPAPEAVTLPASKADVLAEYRGFAPAVQSLLALASPRMDRWAFLDLGDHPPPRFSRGRVCIVGDAAHATTPHLGAGAGLAVEDAMLLAELLADERVAINSSGSCNDSDSSSNNSSSNNSSSKKRNRGLEAAFRAFEKMRVPRSEWLVAASRYVGDIYQFTAEGVGDDTTKMRDELFPIYHKLWDYDVEAMVDEAKLELGRQLDQLQALEVSA